MSSTSKAPTAKQSAYFTSLVKKVAVHENLSGDWAVYESLGLIEANAFGKGRIRNEAITAQAMSRWIDQLKARL